MDFNPEVGSGGNKIKQEGAAPKKPAKTVPRSLFNQKIASEITPVELPSIRDPSAAKKTSFKDRVISQIAQIRFNPFKGSHKPPDSRKVHIEPSIDLDEIGEELKEDGEVVSITAEATDSGRSSPADVEWVVFDELLSELEGRSVLLRIEEKYGPSEKTENTPIENRIDGLLQEVESIPSIEKSSVNEAVLQMDEMLAEISHLQSEQDKLYEKIKLLPNRSLLRKTCRCQIMNLQIELSIRSEALFAHMLVLETSLLYKQFELERVPMTRRENPSPLDTAQILIMQKKSPLEVGDFEPLNTAFTQKKEEVMKNFQTRYIKYMKFEDYENNKPLPKYPPLPPEFGKTLESHKGASISMFKYVNNDYALKIADVSRVYNYLFSESQEEVPPLHLSSDQTFEEIHAELSRFYTDLENLPNK